MVGHQHMADVVMVDLEGVFVRIRIQPAYPYEFTGFVLRGVFGEREGQGEYEDYGYGYGYDEGMSEYSRSFRECLSRVGSEGLGVAEDVRGGWG